MDDVSRIHIPENMVGFAENLDKVVLETPEVGESVLDREGGYHNCCLMMSKNKNSILFNGNELVKTCH